MASTISSDKLALIIKRLKTLKGPGDDKGAFLGNGMPDTVGCDLRSLELSALLEDLLSLRAANSPALDSFEGLKQAITGNAAISKETIGAIRVFVRDKSNPLQERRWIWTNTPARQAPSSVESESSFGPLSRKLSFYDHFLVERYETFDCRELFGQDLPLFMDYYADFGASSPEEMWDQFVGICMDKGLFVVKYDW